MKQRTKGKITAITGIGILVGCGVVVLSASRMSFAIAIWIGCGLAAVVAGFLDLSR